MQDGPIVPLGRSPRTDVILKAEEVVVESGGCVLRLVGLYISFMALSIDKYIYILNIRQEILFIKGPKRYHPCTKYILQVY